MAQWGEDHLRLETLSPQVSTRQEMGQWVWGVEPSALNPEFITLVVTSELRVQ